MTQTTVVENPFTALEQDWAMICRRNRRGGVIERWGMQEPALADLLRLADVVPLPGLDVDRAPICEAVARLHVAGDDLAGRALLQLLIPGMIRIAARWSTRLSGGVTEACWEVITRSSIYIAGLREGVVDCSPAGYVLQSVHRDLVISDRKENRNRAELKHTMLLELPRPLLTGQRRGDDVGSPLPSAEDLAYGPIAVRSALDDAARRGVLPEHAVPTVWLHLQGVPMREAAERTYQSVAAANRFKKRAYQHLQRQLAPAS